MNEGKFNRAPFIAVNKKVNRSICEVFLSTTGNRKSFFINENNYNYTFYNLDGPGKDG